MLKNNQDRSLTVLSNPITRGRSRSHKVDVSSSSRLTCKDVIPIFRVMLVVVPVLCLIIYHTSHSLRSSIQFYTNNRAPHSKKRPYSLKYMHLYRMRLTSSLVFPLDEMDPRIFVADKISTSISPVSCMEIRMNSDVRILQRKNQ